MTEYYIPTQASETEFVEKRSRFIGHVWRVDSEEEARARIEEMKKRYYDARHNCWCYLIKDGPVRYSDDGEPQGTAGQPMLNVFQREGVVNVVCVVTRYFGGILLGAGGLVRAYTQSAKDALDAAGISVVRRWVEILLPCSYAQYERVKLETENFGGVIAEADYGADIALTVLLPEERWEDYLAHMLDITAGTVEGISTHATSTSHTTWSAASGFRTCPGGHPERRRSDHGRDCGKHPADLYGELQRGGEKDDRQAASGGRTAGLRPGPQAGSLPHGVL